MKNTLAAILFVLMLISTDYYENEIGNYKNEINTFETENKELKHKVDNLNNVIKISERYNIYYEKEVNSLRNEICDIKNSLNLPKMKSYKNFDMIWEPLNLSKEEIDFFAKLIYAEGGTMSYEGQFWIASSIINLAKRSNMSIIEMGHNFNMFSVAYIVDSKVPTDTQYKIIYDVLSNGWIDKVCYFRTNHPHGFGKYMTNIDNIYFSSP